MVSTTVRIGDRTLELETGKIARQAHGAVILRDGNTVILATAVYNPTMSRELDFLPLTVDYREYMSAAGRIPGGFLRREGRSSDREVLGSRLCDRSLRPLFPKGYRLETQVISTVLSFDSATDTPVLAMIASAAALHLSEIPWNGPIAALRVARDDSGWVVMPTPELLAGSDLDMVVSLSRDGIVMIEGGANQMPDAQVLEALEFATQAAEPLLEAMETLRKETGNAKASLPATKETPSVPVSVEEDGRAALTAALAEPDKMARKAAIHEAVEGVLAGLPDDGDDAGAQRAQAKARLEAMEGEVLRSQVVTEKRRVDGRSPEDIRPISIETDWLPSTHGSALFTRGETQAMVSLTLGSQQDRMLVETVEGVTYNRFMLHYSFPPYSVGEVRPLRGPGRREVGHGMLARRALMPVLPGEGDFPYTMRLVSEISESNGSSSMATVCGSCLAMMDGGVPLAAPVAGIAMGLIKEGDAFVVLSDILGDEDHLGDMDFKVAGTQEGITALQMDNKIGALPAEVMSQAFDQARQGRLHILGEMAKVLEGSRGEVKANAPQIASISISPQRVRDLIGPGGRVIQELQRTHESRIEVNDEGQVRIFASNRDKLHNAREAVFEIAGTLEVGAVFEGVVTGVKEFGAFVRIRGQDGLVHISEWAEGRVEKMDDVATEGDQVRVKVLEPDRAGRLSLSRKAAL